MKKERKRKITKHEYRSKLDDCSNEKVREYGRKQKNNAKNVHLPEAKSDINCDVKLYYNGNDRKSNNNGKCEIKHDVKSNGRWKQDFKQSTRRCKDCRDKYEKKTGDKRFKKTNSFKKRVTLKKLRQLLIT